MCTLKTRRQILNIQNRAPDGTFACPAHGFVVFCRMAPKSAVRVHSSTPAKRYAMPSEIAALATFMVSDMGDMIVGDTFYMTGGSGTVTLHG